MKTRTIKQSAVFKASPHDVYEALMDSRKHSKFTGGKAVVSRKVGGKFSVFGGGLSGSNLALLPDKKIVQRWRCEMDNWPARHYSTATFSLQKIKNTTRVALAQTGVPSECYSEISKGWREYYWKPMKQMLEK